MEEREEGRTKGKSVCRGSQSPSLLLFSPNRWPDVKTGDERHRLRHKERERGSSWEDGELQWRGGRRTSMKTQLRIWKLVKLFHHHHSLITWKLYFNFTSLLNGLFLLEEKFLDYFCFFLMLNQTGGSYRLCSKAVKVFLVGLIMKGFYVKMHAFIKESPENNMLRGEGRPGCQSVLL